MTTLWLTLHSVLSSFIWVAVLPVGHNYNINILIHYDDLNLKSTLWKLDLDRRFEYSWTQFAKYSCDERTERAHIDCEEMKSDLMDWMYEFRVVKQQWVDVPEEQSRSQAVMETLHLTVWQSWWNLL